jgi:WD40 repeat protein
VTLYDARTGVPRPASADPGGGIDELRFIDRGRALLTIGGNMEARDWRTGRVVRRYADPRREHSVGLSLSPDGRVATAWDWNGDLRLTDGRTGEVLRRLQGPGKGSLRARFAPDGRKLFTLGFDHALRVWDVPGGKELHRLAAHKVRYLSQLAVSPDGKLLAASGGRDGNSGRDAVRLWDVGTGKELRDLPLPGYAGDLTFSPDGTLLAVAVSVPKGNNTAEGAVVVWEVTTGGEVWAQTGPEWMVYGLAFSPDGRVLATGGWDHTLRLWEVASGKQRHAFQGHQGRVGPLAFSPDGRLLAAASPDAPVFVWDVTGAANRRPPTPLSVEERGRLWEALASPDAEAAFQAMRQLVARPDDAASLVRDRLRPAAAHDAERLRRLLRDLDADDFAVRERATAELTRIAEQVEGALRAARVAASAEARRRLDQALRGLNRPSPEQLRQARTMEVLELVATPAAQEVLRSLAGGAPASRLTRDAQAALRRLADRATPSR